MLFVTDLFNILNAKYNYAVLRNYEDLPESFQSHDIDLIIEERILPDLKIDLLHLIEKHQLNILMVNRNERFLTIVLARYNGSKFEFLYLDLFFNYSLYGILFFDAETILARKVYNGKVFHVCKVDEYLEKYLNTTLLNQPYPEKYRDIQNSVLSNHTHELYHHLSSIFKLPVDSFYLNSSSAKKLMLKALFNSLKKRPLKQIMLGVRFIFNYLKAQFSPNGFSFSISGPDGSGKTTILKNLESSFSPIFRELKMYHFRPNVIPRLAELFNKTGLKKEVDVDYHLPHRGGKTGKVSSTVRLFYYIADYIIGYPMLIKPILYRRGMVIFDRYYADIISDSSRSRINLDYKVIFLLRRLVPNLRYNFIICVEPEVILQRKQEITAEKINDINKRLNYLCDNDSQYYPIVNNGKVEDAISEIIFVILKHQHRRYLKFFR